MTRVFFIGIPRKYVWVCLAMALLCHTAMGTTTTTTTAEPEVTSLSAALGRDAHLPCGKNKVFLDGPDAYIIWFRNDQEYLYRFPDNDSEISTTDDDHVYGTTCVEGICYDETFLHLKTVSQEEGGRYICRVHYQASPSDDHIIELHLVEPPGVPHIYDENGKELRQGYVGPVALGAPIHLVCEVQDDQSGTVVNWTRNGVVVDQAHMSGPGLLRTTVHVENATRDELDAQYECSAKNADVTVPPKSAVVIKMNLPPLSVEIRLNNIYFDEGVPRVVDCVVIGCVPAPTVTWHLGNRTLRSNIHKELYHGNFTVSSLTFSPSLRDSDHDLICSAHNENLEDQVFEDKVKIKVGYRPHCVSSREEMIGAQPEDAEVVYCVVDASPAPVKFAWQFADSRTVYTSGKKVSGYTTRYSSVLTWVPRDGEFGSLKCRAINALGEQIRPCMYLVAVGGPPQVPQCYMLKEHPLEVTCNTGWNGGRPQEIHLEVYNSEKRLLLNMTTEDGRFSLPKTTEYGPNFTALVYASSMRGRSDTRTIKLLDFRKFVAGQARSTPATEKDSSRRDWMVTIVWTLSALVVFNLLFVLVKAVCSDRAPVPAPDIDFVATSSNGFFHREPDVAREERAAGATNITLNQLGSCQNQCASSPPPAYRALLNGSRREACSSTTMESYFV